MCPDKYRCVSLESVTQTESEQKRSCHPSIALGRKAAFLTEGSVMMDGQVVGRAHELIIHNGIEARSRLFLETTRKGITDRARADSKRGQLLFDTILLQGSTLER